MTGEIDRLLGRRGSGDSGRYSGGSPSPNRGIGFVILLVLAVIAVFTFFLMCITVVPAGHVGVKDTFGVVDPVVFQPGLHVKNPFTDVKMFSIRTQKYYDYGSQDVATITALSNEGLPVSIAIALNYHIEPGSAANIYSTVGEEYQLTVMTPPVHAVPRDIISKYDVKTLYSAREEGNMDRAKIEGELYDGISRQLRLNGTSRGIVVEQVFIRNIELPAELTNSIKTKLQAEQQIQQKQFEVQVAQKEAERKVAEANGIARANQIIADSLSDKYIKWYWVESMDKNPKTIYVPVGSDGLPLLKPVDGI